MTKYNTLSVKLSNSQLNNLKSVIIHKMFETNASFHVKERKTAKF